jgi:plasmid stabilization system protein ParE
MSWRLDFRPEVEDDVAEAAAWYEAREPGLGSDFVREVFEVWNRLARDPRTGAKGGTRNVVRWLYPQRFPYKVIYRIDESSMSVLVVTVLHAARHDRKWRRRDDS